MAQLNPQKITIIGGGNAGAAFAAQAKLRGRTVSLFDIVESQLDGIISNNNVITIEGETELKGEVKIDVVTTNLIEAVESSKVLICTTPAHTHKHVAKSLASVLTDGQIILLSPGRTGGVLEFEKVLRENNCTAKVVVVESQTIPYACRKTGHTVHIYGLKKEIPCAGIPREDVHNFFEAIEDVYPIFVPCKEGVWGTSLNNIGMLFHPVPTLLNLTRMESGVPFDYYIEGFTPTVCEFVEAMDKERLSLAKAMGISNIPSAVEWLKLNYGAQGSNLYEALQNNKSYYGIKAPQFKQPEDKLSIRYVIEDVPSGLVPCSCLAKVIGVETPAIDLAIQLANQIYNRDFIAIGRNLNQLGLEKLTLDEILNI